MTYRNWGHDFFAGVLFKRGLCEKLCKTHKGLSQWWMQYIYKKVEKKVKEKMKNASLRNNNKETLKSAKRLAVHRRTGRHFKRKRVAMI